MILPDHFDFQVTVDRIPNLKIQYFQRLILKDGMNTSQQEEMQCELDPKLNVTGNTTDSRYKTRSLGQRTNFYSDYYSDQEAGRRGTKYAVIDDERRIQFVQEITNSGCTIKSAARKFGINFSTAKAIMQTYRREGRIGKKQKRETKKKYHLKKSLTAKLRTLRPQRKISEYYDESHKTSHHSSQLAPKIDVKVEEKQHTTEVAASTIVTSTPVLKPEPIQMNNHLTQPFFQMPHQDQQVLFIQQLYQLQRIRYQQALLSQAYFQRYLGQ